MSYRQHLTLASGDSAKVLSELLLRWGASSEQFGKIASFPKLETSSRLRHQYRKLAGFWGQSICPEFVDSYSLREHIEYHFPLCCMRSRFGKTRQFDFAKQRHLNIISTIKTPFRVSVARSVYSKHCATSGDYSFFAQSVGEMMRLYSGDIASYSEYSLRSLDFEDPANTSYEHC